MSAEYFGRSDQWAAEAYWLAIHDQQERALQAALPDADERYEDPEGWEYPSANEQLLDAADDWSLIAADAALPWVDSARVTGDDNPF